MTRTVNVICAGIFSAVIAAPALAQTYTQSVLVPGIAGAAPGTSVHGINGLNFGRDGKLYAGGIVGPGVFRIDVKQRTIEQVVGAPEGEADDVAMAPDGSLVWTALLAGELRIKRPNGQIEVLAANLPMINPVNFTTDGRLLTGQMLQPDTLLEVDMKGVKPVRTIGTGFGGINAFDGDGKGGLYVPLMERGAIARIDLATGVSKIVAEDLGNPAAVKRDSHGGLFTIDWDTGKVTYVNPDSSETRRMTTVTPPLDNLAIGPDDTVYVSRPSDNSIIAVDPNTGAQTPIIQGTLAAPGGLAVITRNGKQELLVTDAFGYRFTDTTTGKTELLPFDLAARASSAVAVNEKLIVTTYMRRGAVTVIDRATGRVQHTLSGFKSPMGVALNAEGEIFVANYGAGEIVRVTPGATPDRTVVASGLMGPVGLAWADDSAVLVTEAQEGTLSRVDIATGAKTVLVRDLAQPEGFAVLPSGAIAIAEVGQKRLTVAHLKTDKRDVIADNLNIGAYFTRAPAPVFIPTGVVADAAGAIYLTTDIDNTILKFTPVTNE